MSLISPVLLPTIYYSLCLMFWMTGCTTLYLLHPLWYLQIWTHMQIWSSLRGLDLQSISIIIGRYASCTLPNWVFTYCGWCFFLNWSSSWWPIWGQLIQWASSSFRTPWPSTVEKWNWSPSCRCISGCHHNTRFINSSGNSRNRKWRAQPSLKLKVCHLSKITLECCFVFRISTTSCRTIGFSFQTPGSVDSEGPI